MKLISPPFYSSKLLTLLFLSTCLSASGVLVAQSSTDTNSGPPAPPYLNRTPDHSAWSVITQGDIGGGDPATDNSTVSTNKQTPLSSQSTVMKSGDTIYEQNTGEDGKVHQIWHIKGLRIEKGSDGVPSVEIDTGGGDIYSVDFSSSDFSSLDWISADKYAGKVKYQGNDVLLFKCDINPLPADVRKANENAQVDAKITAAIRAQRGEKAIAIATPPPAKLVPAIAYIDFKSRLPLFLLIGGEKRNYQYAPLTQAIPMPQEITQALSDYKRRMKLLSQ